VLKRVGAALAGRLRASDLVGRWGGDEFLVVLPDTPAPGAERVAEDLRVTAETLAPPTVCVGWTEWRDDSVAGLVDRAAEALREAQATGPGSVRAG
jgi:diguanylate cyclase (GGDEF)-like protein